MPVKPVDPATLQQWLEQGSALLIDVREPAEHRSRNIAQARSIPLGKIDATQLPEGRRIVVHCLKGGRGASACEKLIRQSPKLEVYNLSGGIDAWAAAGLPIRTAGFVLPLDRQVQMTIGIALLVASGFALFVSPLFVLITGALGLGLFIAGTTGFCGLARVMACAPWNK
jgi:rhodanese-related sulfurtransferase